MCAYCIRSHTREALKANATESEIMEAIRVAAGRRAGAGYAHSTLAFDVMRRHPRTHGADSGAGHRQADP
ncbi:carboxymuconolactone decarboxylase family protein [Paraburkholderia lycopersici]|uniref:carboxymuconolactone decarboxylase family protein n=1 Tax=Paraburkholderia lycopersici TaxID=416944 RepID=UPI000B86DC51|nr:carboxymuconolactone decarboxylase family protein [Paraburkholderia lycopersici]